MGMARSTSPAFTPPPYMGVSNWHLAVTVVRCAGADSRQTAAASSALIAGLLCLTWPLALGLVSHVRECTATDLDAQVPQPCGRGHPKNLRRAACNSPRSFCGSFSAASMVAHLGRVP